MTEAGSSSLRLREATANDARSIANVHVPSRRAAYAHFFPADYLEGLTLDYARALWANRLLHTEQRVIVAEDGRGRVIGYVWLDDLDGQGTRSELTHLFVHPDSWNQGVGSALLGSAEELMARKGFEVGFLWVYKANTRARAFYEKRGWRSDGEERDAERGGTPLPQLRYVKGLQPDRVDRPRNTPYHRL